MQTPTYKNGHTEACAAAQQRRAAEQAAFYAQYPDACRSCGAIGLIESDLDFTTGGIDLDVCEDCLGVGKCPLCAGPLIPVMEAQEDGEMSVVDYEDRRPCGHDEVAIQAPPEVECYCWIGEADRALDEARQADAERGDEFEDDLAYDAARERAASGRVVGRD